jgi:ABC-type nitrate/sulfonate/bicarbonate transport system substrate-binding protein
LALGVAAIATVTALTACGGGSSSTTTTSGGLTNVTFVGASAGTPSTLNLQSNLLDQNGFAANYGIKLGLQTAPGPEALASLQSGKTDFVLTNQATVLSAVNSGAHLRIVAGYSMTFPTAIVSKTSITTVAQLAGKTIAVSTLGDVPQIYTNAYLIGSGLVDPKSVKWAGAGNNSNAMAYLTGGRADAAWVNIANLPTVLKNTNLHVLVSADDFAKYAPSDGSVLVVTDDFATSHKDTVQKVVDMVIGANRKLYDDQAGYLALAQKMLPGVYTPEQLAQQYDQLKPTLAINGGMDTAIINQGYGVWFKYTAPDGGKNVTFKDGTAIFDPSFAATTVKKLGLTSGAMDTGDLLGIS